MKGSINLSNNYYMKIVNNKDDLPAESIDVENLNIVKVFKRDKILIKIDFNNLNVKKYKNILKKMLRVKRMISKKNVKKGMKKDSKILLGYLVNYDESNRQQKEFITGINAILYETKYERYNYIYDTVCDYLDSCFYERNLCDFKDNKCGEKRNTSSLTGCCHHFKNKLLGPLSTLVPCEYLQEDYSCKAKCISCKLFTCDYLRKKGIKFKMKDILLLDTFFNPLQKYFIKYMVFTPKEKIIKLLMIF